MFFFKLKLAKAHLPFLKHMSRFRFPCPRLRTALGVARGCVMLSCFQTQKCSRWPFTESNCWTLLNSWMNGWSMKPIKTSSLIMLKFHHSHCKAGVGTRSSNSGSVFSRNWCSGSGRPFYVNWFTGNANNICSKANCSVLDVLTLWKDWLWSFHKSFSEKR